MVRMFRVARSIPVGTDVARQGRSREHSCGVQNSREHHFGEGKPCLSTTRTEGTPRGKLQMQLHQWRKPRLPSSQQPNRFGGYPFSYQYTTPNIRRKGRVRFSRNACRSEKPATVRTIDRQRYPKHRLLLTLGFSSRFLRGTCACRMVPILFFRSMKKISAIKIQTLGMAPKFES